MSDTDSSEDTSTDSTLTEVNGTDLTQTSNQESLDILNSAPDPIILEVFRKSSTDNCDVTGCYSAVTSPLFEHPMVASSTQTEKNTLDEELSGLLALHKAALKEMYPFIPGGELMQPSCRQGVCFSPSLELGLTDIEMDDDQEPVEGVGAENEEPIYDDPWDLARPAALLSGLDIEYEDVTLLRQCADDKLGLTLCYETHACSEEDEEPLTDVYVSEIEADSIAAQNGRIREGDQILQINNTEVTSRDQAIRLFSENANEVTVTIARHVLQVDDGFSEERSAAPYPHAFPTHLLHTDPRLPHHLLTQPLFEGLEEGGSTDTASTSKSKQDSGLGRTDDSLQAEESSEQECIDTDFSFGTENFLHNENALAAMSPDQCGVLSNNVKSSGYNPHCDTSRTSGDNSLPTQIHANCTYSNCSGDDHDACVKTHLHNIDHVTRKPPRSPSNRSDSALGGCTSSSGAMSSGSKSDSSTQSSPGSGHPHPLPATPPNEHIYDEPFSNDATKNGTTFMADLDTAERKCASHNSYLSEINQLNREIETMRLECRKMHENNRALTEMHRITPPPPPLRNIPELKSPRVVPRMGTRLDYLRQLQAIQQIDQMRTWMQHHHITNVMNGNHESAKFSSNTTTPSPPMDNQPYCVSHLNAMSTLKETANEQVSDNHSHNLQTDTEYKTSSNTSAYNSADSSGGAPLTLDLKPSQIAKPMGTSDDGGGGFNMSMLSLAVSNVQGDSARTPSNEAEEHAVRLQWCKNNSLQKKDKTNGDKKSKNTSSRSRPKEGEKCPMVPPPRQQSSHMTQTPTDNLRQLYTQYADVMYTNQANLQHTMMLQQKLFQQQLLVQQAKQAKFRQMQQSETTKSSGNSRSGQQEGNSSKRQKSHASTSQDTGSKKKSSPSKSQSSSAQKGTLQKSPTKSSNVEQIGQFNQTWIDAPPLMQPLTNQIPSQPNTHVQTTGNSGGSGSDNNSGKGGVQMEWVVKIRPDGSRYFTRRPVRSKMLRERARKLHEERCGMTTDDDAMSELKVGRYWSKDERKRHLEKAREYKRKKEQALKQKSDAAAAAQKESGSEQSGDNKMKKESNILELSQKKMLKQNYKKALDNFTTVQEMLVHGNRHVEMASKAAPNPLLSVTTV